MNKDQIKGAAKEAAGKMQSGAGKATGSTEHRAKGAMKTMEGKAQKKLGNARENVKDAAADLETTRRTRH